MRTERYIFTASEDAKQIALNEINITDKTSRLAEWLSPETGLMQSEISFNDLAELFLQAPPVFIRHIFPVHMETEARNMDCIKDMACMLDKNKAFSVQVRLFDTAGESKYEVAKNISDYLEAEGYVLNVSNPEQIISLLRTDAKLYAGVSSPVQNLSSWSGGMHRFLKDDELISRAEFKLLEAIDIFNIKISEGMTALDMGAAPGGWTRVMLSRGAKVYAVDPADLSEKITGNTAVAHFKKTAQKFLADNQQGFDIILNDMKLDVKESTELMAKAEPALKHDGIGIITLKLPKKGWQKTTFGAIGYLKKFYTVIGARQLFHNRSEVTVILQKSIVYEKEYGIISL